VDAIPYSAKADDLYYPAKHAVFFPQGRPASEAALCAEMCRVAYCQQASGFAFDQERMGAVLDSIGFKIREFLESPHTPEHEGTHCFLAVGRDGQTDGELAVLAFRGTNKDDLRDVVADLKFLPQPWKGGGRVHRGFAESLAEIEPALDAALRSITGRLLITGHSLGAAMATLVASWRKPASLYTIGSPRVGDKAFLATLHGVENHRYVDCCDVVTRVPFLMGYRHLGDPYYIARDRDIRYGRNSLAILTDRLRASWAYQKQYGLEAGNLPARELADHAPINYVSAISAADSPQSPARR